jgi:hypothetical protein
MGSVEAFPTRGSEAAALGGALRAIDARCRNIYQSLRPKGKR